MPATCSDCGRSGRRIRRLGWCDLSLSGGVGQAATGSGVRCLRSDSLLSWSDRTSTRAARSESDERRVEDGRGGLGHAATLRFPSPLIKPDVRISRIRLSDWFHRAAHGGGRVRCVLPKQWAMADAPSNTDRRPSSPRGKLLQKRPDTQGCSRLIANHRSSAPSKAHQKQGPFPPPALPGLNGRMALSDSRPTAACATWGLPAPVETGLPDDRITLPACRAPYPGGSRRVPVSIASPLTRPSPFPRRVGIRIFTFETCSGFTRVTARWIAQPPKAAFVTRLQPSQFPTKPLVSYRSNRQLSGWNPPPLVIRAVGALRNPGFAEQDMRLHAPWIIVVVRLGRSLSRLIRIHPAQPRPGGRPAARAGSLGASRP